MADTFNRHTAKPTSAGNSGDVIFYDGTDFTDDFVAGKGIYISNGTNWTQIMSMTNSAKTYKALISQSGTNAPTAKVLENTLGGTVLWTRDNPGRYNLELTGAFVADKTMVLAAQLNNPLWVIVGDYQDDNSVHFRISDNGVYADDLLNDTAIEILVYPA